MSKSLIEAAEKTISELRVQSLSRDQRERMDGLVSQRFEKSLAEFVMEMEDEGFERSDMIAYLAFRVKTMK